VFQKKTVESITAAFTKMVEDLRELVDKNNKLNSDRIDEIQRLEEARLLTTKENEKAIKVILKLNDITGE
jgi:proline dehydrogenase